MATDAADALRRAMEAAGVDPEAVAREAAEVGIPDDEEDAAYEAWLAERRLHRIHGTACALCSADVKVDDRDRLREVTGWVAVDPPEDGSPPVVWEPQPGTRQVCGSCAAEITGPKQESLL